MQLGMNKGLVTAGALFTALTMLFHPNNTANVCILKHRFIENKQNR